MADTTRIPRTIAQFNDYIRTTDDHLQAEASPGPPPVLNWERLGLTLANATDWHDARLAWDDLFTLYSSPATRTKDVTLQVRNAREQFIALATPLLNIMAASPNATEQDEVIFRFKRSRSAPTRPTAPITDACMVTLQPIGGGEVRITCRTDSDTQRPSLAPGADSIQFAFRIGDTAPQNPHDGTDKEIVTRASHLKEAGAENSGKRIYVFARWYMTSYPELAGPWSPLSSVMIM